MKVLCFHNEHQSQSRDLVSQLRTSLPNVEIVDFMKARSEYQFQGTPCVWIGGESPDAEVWSKVINVTAEEVRQAVANARALTILADPPGPYASGAVVRFVVTAADVDDQATALPDALEIMVGEQEDAVTAPGADLLVTFRDPGIYAITAHAPFSVPARLEVEVSGV